MGREQLSKAFKGNPRGFPDNARTPMIAQWLVWVLLLIPRHAYANQRYNLNTFPIKG